MFARIHSLTAGLVLYFKLMEGGLLSVKVFGDLGTRLKCCVESSSDDEDSSSSGSDEEDSDNDDEGVGRQDADPDFDSSRRPSLGLAPCRGPSSSSSPSARSPSPPWAAGVGGPEKAKKAGGGRQVGVRGHRRLRRVLPARCLVFQLLSRHQDVLLVRSVPRTSPMHPFCPPLSCSTF